MINVNRWYASIIDVIKKPNEKGRLSTLIFKIRTKSIIIYNTSYLTSYLKYELS